MQAAPFNRRILVIDDNESIHGDFRKILGSRRTTPALDEVENRLFGGTHGSDSSLEFQMESAFQGREGLERVRAAVAAKQPYAMAFVDVRMPPGWDGIETVAHLWKADPDLQVVICTAYSDYCVDEMLAKLGSSDRLLILKKPFDNIEVLQLANALTEKYHLVQQSKNRVEDLERTVADRTQALHTTNAMLRAEIEQGRVAAAELQATQRRLQHLLAKSPVVLYSLRMEGSRAVPTWVSENLLQLLGYSPAEWARPGWRSEQLHPDDRAAVLAAEGELQKVGHQQLEYRLRHRDGSYRFVRDESRLIREAGDGHDGEIIGAYTDITERKLLEEQLRQSQKMEAIGQLAGGVAHDFNNLLTVIRSYTSLMLEDPQLAPEMTDHLNQVSRAVDRAADLTRQLLAYGRRQFVRREKLDVNDVIANLAKMLSRILGEDIALEVVPPQTPCVIEADRTMVEQIILNLAANSRDAMTRGGRLTIRTSVIEVAAGRPAPHPDAQPGQFACVSVSDTGCGIAPGVLPRIFEPFFTTKDVGKGTGLGLATVYGIVKLHQGWAEVDSQLNRGTTFRIYLPLCRCPEASVKEATPPRPTPSGSETVLLVEDEASLRKVARTVLERNGYRIFEAGDGVDAIRVWHEHATEIDVLVTDMVMPAGMTGRELAAKLHIERPALKVLYTSGYSDELLASNGVALGEADFLAKPYTPQMLLGALRRTIDA